LLLPALLALLAIGSCSKHASFSGYEGIYEEAAGGALGGGDFDELWILGVEDSATPQADPPEPEDSAGLRAVVEEGGEEIQLPLVSTQVQARIDAFVATVDLRQVYQNPLTEPVELVYVFPLPQDAAVSEFVMTVGERRIRGIVREREEAEEIYEQARSQGYVASLLTQERPNVFTQRVANIEPGHDVLVDLRYQHVLPYRDGAYSYVFPTVVGPRYNPPGSVDGIGAVSPDARGLSGQSVEVVYQAEGAMPSFSLSLDLDAGVFIEDVSSDSHEIEIETLSSERRRVTLAQGEAPTDRDFRLRYAVAGQQVKSAMLLHADERGQWFTLLLHPPASLQALPASPVELIYVIDCSGSMSGAPLRTAKAAVRRSLAGLGPEDAFQVVRFSSKASRLGPEAVPATRAALREGLQHLDRLRSGGGTEMMAGVRMALGFPHQPGRVRLVTFMTDGYIGNEREVLATVSEGLGQAHVFSFGVGSATNRFLLDRMAKLGQGAAAYVTNDEAVVDREVDAFMERIRHPALAEVSVDFGDARVAEVFPGRIPDLWVGRPLVLTGRIEGPVPDQVTVRGYLGGEPVSIPVPVRVEQQRRPALPLVWARAKIADLAERSLLVTDPGPMNDGIRAVALEYGLLCRYTAFVAVDASAPVATDSSLTVAVPVPVPEGVSFEATVQEPEAETPEH